MKDHFKYWGENVYSLNLFEASSLVDRRETSNLSEISVLNREISIINLVTELYQWFEKLKRLKRPKNLIHLSILGIFGQGRSYF